uniref:CRISP-like factor variant 3 n=1 Tax=Plethodon cinereus TaxID=141976 RepID=W8QQ24_9SALA|nr:CRISP-like factor variant 3 [Plethodon cinereus]
MGLLLLLGSVVLTVLAVGPRYTTGEGVLMPLSMASKREIVNKHNQLRRSVQPTASNMQRMAWNTVAALNAAKWAKKCDYDNHSPLAERKLSTCECGENIFWATFPYTMSYAIQDWYDEEKDFEYGIGEATGGVITHYTQIVWAKSSKIGCAMAQCDDRTVLVCHYCVKGNFGSLATPYLSGTPCSECPTKCDKGLCTNPCLYVDEWTNCADFKSSCDSDPVTKSNCGATCNCT